MAKYTMLKKFLGLVGRMFYEPAAEIQSYAKDAEPQKVRYHSITTNYDSHSPLEEAVVKSIAEANSENPVKLTIENGEKPLVLYRKGLMNYIQRKSGIIFPDQTRL